MLEPPKVILELPSVMFCHLESIRSSGFCLPRSSGIIFSVELIPATDFFNDVSNRTHTEEHDGQMIITTRGS